VSVPVAAVTETREAAMDSNLLKDTSRSMFDMQKKRSQRSNNISFRKFEGGLRRLFGIEGDDTRPLDWSKMGLRALELLQRTPTGHFMLGALDAGVTEKRKEKKQRLQREVDGPTQSTQLNNLGEKNGMKENERPDNAHEAQIHSIRGSLVENATDDPVGLYRFALVPDDDEQKAFAQTVENLFGLAFLVKENYAEHSVNEKGLQLIKALPRESAESTEVPTRTASILK